MFYFDDNMKKYYPYYQDPFYEDKIKEKEYHKQMGRLEAEKDFKEGKKRYYGYKSVNYDFEDNFLIRLGIPFLVFMYGVLFKKWWIVFLAIILALIFNFKSIIELINFSKEFRKDIKKK